MAIKTHGFGTPTRPTNPVIVPEEGPSLHTIDPWICPECETINTSSVCVICEREYAPQVSTNEIAPPPQQTNGFLMAWSILMIFICLPMGVFATIQVYQANLSANPEEQAKLSRAATTMNILGCVITPIILIWLRSTGAI